jgi:hypothetical protein
VSHFADSLKHQLGRIKLKLKRILYTIPSELLGTVLRKSIINFVLIIPQSLLHTACDEQ